MVAPQAGVVHPLKEGDGGRVLADHEERLAAPGGFQPGQPDAQVRGGTGWRRPPDQGRREAGQVGQAALLIQVRGQVPWLVGRRAHHEQAAGRPRRSAQRTRKGLGPLQPPARAKQLPHDSHLVGIHPSMVPDRPAPRS